MESKVKKIILVGWALFVLSYTPLSASVTQWYYQDGSSSVFQYQNEPHNPYTILTDSVSDPRDPIEPVNRVFFFINDLIDGLFLQPFAKIYNGVLPDCVKTRISHVLLTLMHPVIFGNDLLQGEFEDAGITLSRFLINATFGVAGMFEVAEDWGLPYKHKDFGQTFARWGIGEGFYFVIPILGPSTARDGIGRAGDLAMNPLTWVLVAPVSYTYTGTTVSHARADVEPLIQDLKANSIDYYAAIRSWYFERREYLIKGHQDQLLDTPTPDDNEE